jgi:hypothetical protein
MFSAPEESAALSLITQAEFARSIGVSRAAIGNMRVRGQLTAPALVERAGRIFVDADVALVQLRERLDVKQRVANGRSRLDGNAKNKIIPSDIVSDATRLSGGAKISAPDKEPEPDAIFESIKAARLRQLDLSNEASALAARLKGGGLVPSDRMRAECGRVAASVVAIFDGLLPGVADEVAAASGMAFREALHLLRAAFRAARGRISSSEEKAARALPELVPVAAE